MLHDLVHGRDVDGRALTDEEIVDQVITLIIAGHETTSAALSWAVYLLLTNPDAYAAARAEVRDVLGAEAPVAADLTRLAYLGRVVQESLRVGTPVTIFPRTTVRDIDVAGDRIPADTLVILCPYLIHRDPDVWPEPLRFRPERWDPDDPAYRAPVKGAYLPFGGGSHRCIGSAMATTEITVFLARMLARTGLYLPQQRVRATGILTTRPKTLRVTVTTVTL